MNCAGSERAENNKGFDCRNMGEVLGKECVKEEPSFTHSSQDSFREVGEGAASSGAASESESDKDVSVDSEEDISWLLSFSTDELCANKCKCEGCLRRNESCDSEKKNAKLLLSSWKEFQSYIRNVYINSPLKSAQRPEMILIDENERLHELVQVMRLCDPYQLFQKIEDEVRGMVLQSRNRQLSLLKNESNPALAEEFISGLVEEYVKLLSSALQLSSAIEVLLGSQLQRFGLTWDMLNKHLYQSLVYTHYEVQENLPRFISQLTMLPLKDEVYHDLVHEYLAFDDEMTSIEAAWEKIEPNIQDYKNSKAREMETLNSLQDALRAFFANKLNSMNGNGSVDGSANSVNDEASQYCPNCLTKRGCPCDECTVTHMMSCEGMDSPSTPSSPVSRSRSPVKDKIENEEVTTEEQQSCECHACTVPPPELMDCSVTFNELTGKSTHGEGFHLYPHIHGTVAESLYEADNISSIYGNLQATPDNVYPHLYNLHNQANSIANVSQVNIPGTIPNRTQLTQPALTNKLQSQPLPVSTRPQQEIRGQVANATSAGVPSKATTCPPPPPPQDSQPSKVPSTTLKSTPAEKPVSSTQDVPKKPAQPKQAPNLGTKSSETKPADSKPDAKKNQPVNKVTTTKESDAVAKPAAEKPKLLPNNKGTACVKSRICGMCCLRHGPNCMKSASCGKNNDKPLAAIAKLGLATGTNSRGALRCPPGKETEHSHKPGKGHSCGKLKAHDVSKKPSNGKVNGQEPDDSSSQDDTCSERSNSTSASTQRDSRHCDCCYCEVFGHGVPSVAPVSRNYQEMRERLRIRLNMKKSAKCKAGQGPQPGEKTAASAPNSQDDAKKGAPKEKDLESLLKFIEGKTREECKNPKRQAKRARQRQKKLEEKERLERLEEEEADRKRLEAMKRQVTISVVNDNNKKAQPVKQNPPQPTSNKQQQQQQQQQQHQNQKASSKNTNTSGNMRNNTSNNNRNNSNSNSGGDPRNNQTLNLSGLKSLVEKSDPNSGPKMVTIRRVMAPFSAEPTVTITLKGSTPDKDKVLFMLKNGSETYQPEEKEATKKSKRKRKKAKKEPEYYEEEEEEDEDEPEPETYYEEEQEPVARKSRRKRRRNKNKNAEAEVDAKSARGSESSKSTATDKSGKGKNAKQGGLSASAVASGKGQSQATGKGKGSNSSASVKSSGQASNSKANSQKNVVPVLKAQNVKNREVTNSKTNKNVSSTKNNSNSSSSSHSQSNNSKSNQNSNSVKGGAVRNNSSVNSVSVTTKNSKSNQKQTVAVSNPKSVPVQSGKNQGTVATAKQSKTKKIDEAPQASRQTQAKTKASESKTKTVQKTGKNEPPATKATAQAKQTAQERQRQQQQQQQQQQEMGKKSKTGQRSGMESHDIGSRFPVGDRYDRGKVVINTPSYRLSEVLSSIAPSPPPKEEINLENLRLPPGITITKIEGPITKSIRASEQPLHVSKPVPISPPIVVSTPTLKQSHPPPPGNVIVVDTGRLKEVIKENSLNNPPQSVAQPATTSKKKKKKNKQNAENTAPTVDVPMTQPKFGLKMTKGGNPAPVKGGGVTVISADEARKMVPSLENQQATIIKTSDNMVTIRSPAFQQAMNMHAYQNSQSFRPGINGYNNVSLFREDVTRIADGLGKLKLSNSEDKLARQMRSLNIKEGSRASQIFAQAMAAAGQNGQDATKKKKKKRRQGSSRSDEKEVEPVESVFQPKDIDLENGDIDDDERELEAFKRFCLQSVPSERKNKVKVNLNIKDIVLKKKSSAIGCS